MNVDCSGVIRRLVKGHEKWLSSAGDMVREELEFIEEDLAEASARSLLNITDSLKILATYYGVSGGVGVIRSNGSRGRADIARSVAYHYWALRVRAERFATTSFMQPITQAPNLTNLVSAAACLACYGIACKSEELASYCLNILSHMSTVSGLVDESYWKRRVFEPFVLELAVLRENGTPSPQQEKSPFADILEGWKREEDFAALLESVCDYHCANMVDKGGSWDPEFKNAPFDLVPVEVLAVLAVRRESGLRVPVVEHPLLETPLAKLELPPLAVEDHLLQRVQELNAEFSVGAQ